MSSRNFAFAALNLAGLLVAVGTGVWRLKQIYDYSYFPIAAIVWTLGGLGLLPRVKASTKGEGHERRYFYGAVWASSVAQPVLGILWKLLPHTRAAYAAKLIVFTGILSAVGWLAYQGRLPRTGPLCLGNWQSRTSQSFVRSIH